MKRLMGGALILLSSVLIAGGVEDEQPLVTSNCHQEWVTAYNDQASFIGTQLSRINATERTAVTSNQSALYWRIEQVKQLVKHPYSEGKDWPTLFDDHVLSVGTTWSIALSMSGSHYGQPLMLATSAEEQPSLYAMVRDLSEKSGVRVPLVSIVDSKSCGTAWVVSTNEENSPPLLSIGSRLLEMLDDQSLKAVLAHEFAHVERRHLVHKVNLERLCGLFDPMALFLLSWGVVGGATNAGKAKSLGLAALLTALYVFARGKTSAFVQYLKRKYAFYIERDADWRAGDLHRPAVTFLQSAFEAMKKERDAVLVLLKKGHEEVREYVRNDFSLEGYVREMLLWYITALETSAIALRTDRTHPPLEERIETMCKREKALEQ